MKYAIFIIVIPAACLIIGCSRSDTAEPAVLVAKWTLVRDSTANSIGAAAVVTGNYKGVAGDYFDFRADGKCYTKEGNTYDTLAYKRVAIDQVTIEKFGFSSSDSPCLIDPFTAHKATITSPVLYTPGGYTYRQVVLGK